MIPTLFPATVYWT